MTMTITERAACNALVMIFATLPKEEHSVAQARYVLDTADDILNYVQFPLNEPEPVKKERKMKHYLPYIVGTAVGIALSILTLAVKVLIIKALW